MDATVYNHLEVVEIWSLVSWQAISRDGIQLAQRRYRLNQFWGKETGSEPGVPPTIGGYLGDVWPGSDSPHRKCAGHERPNQIMGLNAPALTNHFKKPLETTYEIREGKGLLENLTNLSNINNFQLLWEKSACS